MKQFLLHIVFLMTIAASVYGGENWGYRLGYAEATAGMKTLESTGMAGKVSLPIFIDEAGK